ncbi:MAG: dephospho-CoA kinase [Actinomycetota bacterium]|nr:dephospho-CoA kinase [Actinomycetota bacterium]
MVPFIGLTGGIGSGKTTALRALEKLGAAGLSTDQVVHELYESAEVADAVQARFGDEVIRDGVIDRPAVAQEAFASPDRRQWLEQLLWPRVGARIAAWRQELNALPQPPRAAVVEVPLLFEAGMESAFDCTLAVIADEGLRHQRASGRGHQALDERGARQLSQEEKAQRATYSVLNDGTEAELVAKLSAILDMLG